jgi:hypothetical protein
VLKGLIRQITSDIFISLILDNQRNKIKVVWLILTLGARGEIQLRKTDIFTILLTKAPPISLCPNYTSLILASTCRGDTRLSKYPQIIEVPWGRKPWLPYRNTHKWESEKIWFWNANIKCKYQMQISLCVLFNLTNNRSAGSMGVKTIKCRKYFRGWRRALHIGGAQNHYWIVNKKLRRSSDNRWKPSQDGCRGGHLEWTAALVIERNLPPVTPNKPQKNRSIRSRRSSDNRQKRNTRWLPWRPSWMRGRAEIMERNLPLITPNKPQKNQINRPRHETLESQHVLLSCLFTFCILKMRWWLLHFLVHSRRYELANFEWRRSRN